MKYISILILTLILFVNYAYAAYDDITNLFIDAKELKLNVQSKAELSQEYDVDSFTFTAPSAGYYSILGVGETELRGHLYNSDIKFMRTGDTFREDNVFFIVVYLQKNERIFIKVDSTIRRDQKYKIGITKENLPFNKVKPQHNKVETYINPKAVKTIKIPLSFYNNDLDLGYISKAYTYLMQIKSNGVIQGQAGFNTDTYELELDIYGETDATLTISLGADVSCTIAVKALIQDDNTIDNPITEPNIDTPNNQNPQNPNPPVPVEPIAKVLQGDCNLDNVVNINDVTALLDVNELSKFNEKQFRVADVTKNGIVDFTDALIILRRVTGAR